MLISRPKSKKLVLDSMQIQMSTSMEYFISGIKNEKTKEVYLYQIEQFRDHFKIKDYDSLLKIPEIQPRMLSKSTTLSIIILLS